MSGGGKRRVDIREVANEAGVAISTVSNALNRPERVTAATRDRVIEVAQRLGYVPNASARQLRGHGGRMVGAVLLDTANPYYSELVRGMEDRLALDDFLLVVCSSDRDPEREGRYLRSLRERNVEAALVTPAEDDISELEAFGATTPIVLLDRPRPDRTMCSVHVDDVRGGVLGAAHLLSLGHRRIAFVNGPRSIHACVDRAAGVTTALEEAGVDPRTALLEINTDQLNADGGELALESVLADADPPTAIFCINDLVALGVIRGARKRGLKIPDDLAVVGYDDVEFAAMLMPPLTSIRQPKYQVGRAAAELLLAEASQDPDHRHHDRLFQPELVVRETSQADRQPRVVLP
ncbi:LacI family DNA-binding transcriptional regulator [Ruania rhizosphaerae]|uniref:LacI family DNA-binding transcriptional regulator n=1 Tax=Ruania rhizosphaerae TaxID=1840413 RepID=UPI00190F3A56|nr:LacI family DNA-binding transcriptional regulator [Ruania rhizosphaerae]